MNIYILILLLSLLPIIYKLSFWLYTIQLKEYRWDRFKEYLRTKQGKSAILNLFSKIEYLLLFLFILSFYIDKFTDILRYIFIGYLILLNLFIILKILKKKIYKPKITSRLIILVILFTIGIYSDLSNIFGENNLGINLKQFLDIYILIVFTQLPFILFFWNLISLPLINYKKNKIIKKAIKKSENINNPPIKIAITGSYGKSSVKEFLSSILEKKFNILKTPENINTELGVSNIILSKLSDKYDYFIAEIGAYRIGEISTLGKIVNHKYGFLTAIGNQHLGLFGGIENTKKAKFEILEKVIENNGILYVNYDNENIKDYLKNIDYKNIVKYGLESKNLDAKSFDIKENNENTQFTFSYKGKEIKYTTNLTGKHNILNLTGILAFCFDQGIKLEEKDLLSIKKPKNTQEIIKHGNLTLIDDSYNLSYEGLLAGLENLKQFKGEKILVLDDILELGKQAEQIHKNLGAILTKKVDKILLVGVNYKNIVINSLLENGFKKGNILKNLDDIQKGVILFEGRGTKKYLDNILKK